MAKLLFVIDRMRAAGVPPQMMALRIRMVMRLLMVQRHAAAYRQMVSSRGLVILPPVIPRLAAQEGAQAPCSTRLMLRACQT